METEKKIMLSGIQPSGDLHLGNYLGAIKNWADRVNEFECYYFMADLHTITVRQDPKELRRRSIEMLALYIACGLDPEKNTLFLQSHVPAHAQLGWVLDCYTMFGELSRMTQFRISQKSIKTISMRDSSHILLLWQQIYCSISPTTYPWERTRSSMLN